MKQKIGTLRCRLFGHCFVAKRDEVKGERKYRYTVAVQYCIRCGEKRLTKL